jgi:hypothetical protein
MNKVNMPEKKVQDKLYKYGSKVLNAKIDGSAKALLWFYAYVFNWEGSVPSWYAQRKICALTGMSQSTYQNKRKYLERLGWIEVLNRGFSETCLVRVKEGMNDPEYENMSWAKWHPENEKKERAESLAIFLSNSPQALENDDSNREPLDTEEILEGSKAVMDDSDFTSW